MTQAAGTKTVPAAKPAPNAELNEVARKEIVPSEPTFEEVRQRAYELYLFRGEKPGSALEDWLEAERELREGQS